MKSINKIQWRTVLLVSLLLIFISAYVLSYVEGEPLKCNIKDTGLNQDWMPEGWHQGGLGPAFLPEQDRLGAQQAYYIVLENETGEGYYSSHHTIYQYSNVGLAVFSTWSRSETFFPSIGWKWVKLQEARSLPLQADQVSIKCGESRDVYLGDRCAAVLRYDSYISYFSSSIHDGVMDIQRFKETVLKIDRMFHACM